VSAPCLCVLGVLCGEIVKSGEFPAKLGSQFARAFEMKTKDDYEAFADPQVSDVKELFAKAREFVDKVDEMIREISVARP